MEVGAPYLHRWGGGTWIGGGPPPTGVGGATDKVPLHSDLRRIALFDHLHQPRPVDSLQPKGEKEADLNHSPALTHTHPEL